MKDRKKDFLNLLKKIIDFQGFNLKQNEIIKVWNILLKDFNWQWLKLNQKFDFSFSYPLSNSQVCSKRFRFSYNNFGEKTNYKKKFLKIFSIYKEGKYNIQVLNSIFELAEKLNNLHQTTLGMEYLANQKFPRLKLYFEELFGCYTPLKIKEILKRIIGILKLERKASLEKFFEMEIGAICVDFLPANKVNLKIYILEKKLNLKKIKKWLKPITPANFKAISVFLSLKNGKYFYYFTFRFSNKNMVEAIKLYKIYNIRQISNFLPVFKEIFLSLNNFSKPVQSANFLNLLKLFKNSGFTTFPVIFSFDLSFQKEKFDLYLTLNYE